MFIEVDNRVHLYIEWRTDIVETRKRNRTQQRKDQQMGSQRAIKARSQSGYMMWQTGELCHPEILSWFW